jgi:flagellar biosynthesis protein FliQ
MLGAAAIGIIAMFLPWVDLYFISVNGMHGKGLLVFLCFVVCGILAFAGDQSKPLDKTMWMIAMIVSGLTTVGMVIAFFQANDVIGAMGIGFYMALIASLALFFVAFIFRASGYNIKDGFDSLKQDITEKTRSNNPPPPQNPL